MDIADKEHLRVTEREALLFNSAVRLLGRHSYTDIKFDIGGKKSRRRFVLATTGDGESQTIWVKAAARWPDGSDAVHFPWKKMTGSPSGAEIVAAACDGAAMKGATHLLAISGEASSGKTTSARLYPLAAVPGVVGRQAEATNSVFYLSRRGSLVVRSASETFRAAVEIAASEGIDLLSHSSAGPVRREVRRSSPESGRIARVRSASVREAVLAIAKGRCECCGEMGFLTERGEHYLETHHVVGIGERGPDEEANVVALCALCHRKAHYSADRVQLETRLLEALRRRPRSRARSAASTDAT